MAKKYKVVPFLTGCLGGSLNETKLQDTLNDESANGWKFVRSIHEEKRIFVILKREAHFLIFERDETSG